MGVVLKNLGGRKCSCLRGGVILEAGSPTASFGVVLSGSVRVENSDIWGNRTVLGVLGAGEIFAEAYALAPGEALMVAVVANTDCEVLFMESAGLFEDWGGEQELRERMLGNLVRICARKNLYLSRRMFHTTSKTIRGRLMSYFSEQVALQGRSRITIPFDRQQLADYLGVDRSALSKELGKMKRDGLLDYYRNTFDIRTDGTTPDRKEPN